MKLSKASEKLVNEAVVWAWLYTMFGLSELLAEDTVLLDPYFFVLAVATYDGPKDFLGKSGVDFEGIVLRESKALLYLLPGTRAIVGSGISYICPPGFSLADAVQEAEQMGSKLIKPSHVLCASLKAQRFGDDVIRKIRENGAMVA